MEPLKHPDEQKMVEAFKAEGQRVIAVTKTEYYLVADEKLNGMSDSRLMKDWFVSSLGSTHAYRDGSLINGALALGLIRDVTNDKVISLTEDVSDLEKKILKFHGYEGANVIVAWVRQQERYKHIIGSLFFTETNRREEFFIFVEDSGEWLMSSRANYAKIYTETPVENLWPKEIERMVSK